MSTLVASQRRRFLRYPPDPMDTAKIDFSKGDTFNPQYVALIRQEAYAGCGLLLVYQEGMEQDFAKGRDCVIQVGKLEPLPAEIVWSSVLDDEVLKVGFSFKE